MKACEALRCHVLLSQDTMLNHKLARTHKAQYHIRIPRISSLKLDQPTKHRNTQDERLWVQLHRCILEDIADLVPGFQRPGLASFFILYSLRVFGANIGFCGLKKNLGCWVSA